MCGIAGIYSPPGGKDRKTLQKLGSAMTTALARRGPDDEGHWQDPNIALLLGHRRLSIIDLSAEGHQPMLSPSERYVITYNGEIYNYLALQKELESAGFTFRGRSDTEVMLAAFEHWGVNQAVQKLDGMFAIALWDRKERKLHLVRDRLGKKPLYVGWAGKNLLFASELKAFHAYPDFKPEINKKALTAYTQYGYVPAPLCIFENIWSIPAGFRVMLELEHLSPAAYLETLMEPYWHHRKVLEGQYGRHADMSDHDAVSHFESLLGTCVKDRMISDVPLGAFLSGGIDSSAIVALMQKNSSRPVKTYTIGFHEAGFDEAGHAAQIARHLGTDHHEHYLSGEDALGVIPKLAEMYDEPFADISAIPTFLVSQFARRDVTVALTGDGGDEMLGGYNRHFTAPKLWNRMRLMPLALRKMIGRGINTIPTAGWDRMSPSHPQFGERMHKIAGVLSAQSPEEIFRRLSSQWQDPFKIVKGAEKFMTPLQEADFDVPDNLSFAEKMMYWDALSYLPNDILTKVDRAGMAVSLEARAPLLDRRIYEFAWGLPQEMKIRGGRGKWLLRKMLEKHVPNALFERPKQGFAIPVSDWLRGPLRGWSEALLREDKLSDFNAAPVRKAWDLHLKGQGNYGSMLWTILMYQNWKERWMP